MSEQRWDFDNMTIDELMDDAEATIDRYNMLLMMIGTKTAIEQVNKMKERSASQEHSS